MDSFLCHKYEGLGNDFLIAFDPDRTGPFDALFARALCDRHLGIGADGLIRLSRENDKGELRMELRNADGSSAETSGNGLRCAALYAYDEHLVDGLEFAITTDAGRSDVKIISADRPVATVSVEMGQLVVEDVASPIAKHRAYAVNIGNPHLVLIGENVNDVDLAEIGPVLEISDPMGLNIEVIALAETDVIDLVVWERGAGLTQACGTGSCAAVAAARVAGLSGERATVRNPGGELVVELSGTDALRPFARLEGPTRRVARIEAELDALLVSSEGMTAHS